MKTERLQIPVPHPRIDAVSALFEMPSGATGAARDTAFLLANGAGFHMEAHWMESVGRGLVERGFPTLRFNYAYRERAVLEKKQRPPDAAPRLEETHRCVLAALRERVGDRRIVLAGKSLGARISSYLAAKGEPCSGLVFYGYPLHPPKKTDKLRVEHFPAVTQPSLFLQGTRDALADLELLQRELKCYGGPVTLEIIEGADHSFHVPKKLGKSDAEVLADLLDRTDAWVKKTLE